MDMSLSKDSLVLYIVTQLNSFFPDGNPIESDLLLSCFDRVLKKLEYCFSFVNNKYFFNGKHVLFNHLNTDQYAMLLYILSKTLYKETQDSNVCEKIFYLNKSLHGIDAFYEVELPDIFLFVHPLGTVLGRGNYSNHFLVYQRCGIGSNRNKYPALGEYVSLHPGATVIGDCRIGKNCKISTNSLLMDHSLNDNSVYAGTPQDYSVKKSVQKLEIWRK